MNIDRRWITASAALIAFTIGLKTASMWIQARDKLGDAATWAGAIGATLAFVATMWIATEQTRQKNLEAHNRAVLSAAKHLPSLNRCLSKLNEGTALLAADINQGSISSYGSRLFEIRNSCDWAVEELEPLAVLPRNAAYRLARIGSDLGNLVRQLDEVIMQKSTYNVATSDISYDVAACVRAIQQFCDSVTPIRKSLKVAIAECESILPVV